MTFKNGIHPVCHGKELSEAFPVQTAPLLERYTVTVAQNAGFVHSGRSTQFQPVLHLCHKEIRHAAHTAADNAPVEALRAGETQVLAGVGDVRAVSRGSA